jgi:hypothetical protein
LVSMITRSPDLAPSIFSLLFGWELKIFLELSCYFLRPAARASFAFHLTFFYSLPRPGTGAPGRKQSIL